MPIFQLLYVSGASRPMNDEDIDEILAVSRANNAAAGVTGMLLHADGTFIQVLEGEKATVKQLAARISGDSRHRNFMVLVERETDARAFADWQMGFRKLDPAREEDGAVFAVTREALEKRIAPRDGIMLDTVLAFGRDFLPA